MSVEQSWARITAWLTTHAPVTAARIRPAADGVTREATEAAFPTPWPDDLRRWYSLQDGESMEVLWRCVLPMWAVLPVARVLDEREMWLELTGDADDEEPAPEAGDIAFTFLPEFVPIAENGCGDTLFVDLRPGASTGCVTEYAAEEADTHGPSWPSVTAMLDELADSLERSGACGGCLPSVEDGELTWAPEGAEDD